MINEIVENYEIVARNNLKEKRIFTDIEEYLEWSKSFSFYDLLCSGYTNYMGEYIIMNLQDLRLLINDNTGYHKEIKKEYILYEYSEYLKITNEEMYYFLNTLNKIVSINNKFDIENLKDVDINNLIEMSKLYYLYKSTNISDTFINVFKNNKSIYFTIDMFECIKEFNYIKHKEFYNKPIHIELFEKNGYEDEIYEENNCLEIIHDENGEECDYNYKGLTFTIKGYSINNNIYFNNNWCSIFELLEYFIPTEKFQKYNLIEKEIKNKVELLKNNFNNYVNVNLNNIRIANKNNFKLKSNIVNEFIYFADLYIFMHDKLGFIVVEENILNHLYKEYIEVYIVNKDKYTKFELKSLRKFIIPMKGVTDLTINEIIKKVNFPN